MIMPPSGEGRLTALLFSFQKHYKYRPLNFSDALAHLDMEFDGTPHSGIADARNLAQLAGRMAQDGALICLTTDMQPQRLLYRPFY